MKTPFNKIKRLCFSLLVMTGATSAVTHADVNTDSDIYLDKRKSEYVYPDTLYRPPRIWYEFIAAELHADKIQGYETPIAVYQTMRVDHVMWNCVAAFDDKAVSTINFKRPKIVGHKSAHNSEARALCMVHAVNKLISDGLIPDAAPQFQEKMARAGLDPSYPSDRQARKIVKRGDRTPRAIGHYLAAQMLKVMRKDGLNFDGALNSKGEPCTANCLPYGDNGAMAYAPVNNPFTPPEDPTRWQPLLEHNNKGFVVAQGHVTPHIGAAPLEVFRTPIFSKAEIAARTLDNPNYDLEAEAQAAIEEVALTGESDFRKIAVEFFDNKINLAGGLIYRLRETYNLSLEAQLMYHIGYSSAEYDSVVLAWREKIKHDLIRPTTVVQAKGDETIISYKGPLQGTGELAAQDWHPYIRTMPHAEFPSGSGCICGVVAEYVDAFVQDQYGQETLATNWTFPAGSSKIEPGVTPASPVHMSFSSMTELRNMCGDSRLWGGMHFKASVPAAYELCEGIGTKAYTHYSRELLPAPLESLFGDAETIY